MLLACKIVVVVFPNRNFKELGSPFATLVFSINKDSALPSAVELPAENRNRWPVTFVESRDLNRNVMEPEAVEVVFVVPPPLIRFVVRFRKKSVAFTK